MARIRNDNFTTMGHNIDNHVIDIARVGLFILNEYPFGYVVKY